MKILFTISLVCFAALLWAVYAIARHVRRNPGTPVDPALSATLETIDSGPGSSFRSTRSTHSAPDSAKTLPAPAKRSA